MFVSTHKLLECLIGLYGVYQNSQKIITPKPQNPLNIYLNVCK